jgi:zinc D-Ala-D-Ala dipeptidase
MKKTVFFFLIFTLSSLAQEVSLNKYGLPVVDSKELYIRTVEFDSSKLFVDLEDLIEGVILEIRYASDDNFYGSPVYNDEKAFLRTPAAEALVKVQEELQLMNKGLKIFDAYRPYGITLLFYEKIKDTNFVASAWTGSRHNRGCAVDLTIVDLSSGEELKMPTQYDDFTEKASIDYPDVTSEEKQNRELLQKVMIKYGFLPLKSEWWHFDFSEWKKFELTDIDFDELEEIYLEYKEVNEYAR